MSSPKLLLETNAASLLPLDTNSNRKYYLSSGIGISMADKRNGHFKSKLIVGLGVGTTQLNDRFENAFVPGFKGIGEYSINKIVSAGALIGWQVEIMDKSRNNVNVLQHIGSRLHINLPPNLITSAIFLEITNVVDEAFKFKGISLATGLSWL